MKITIDNKSSISDAEAVSIVASLLKTEQQFIHETATTGGQFLYSISGIKISRMPVSKLYPAGELAFWVVDMKGGGK